MLERIFMKIYLALCLYSRHQLEYFLYIKYALIRRLQLPQRHSNACIYTTVVKDI